MRVSSHRTPSGSTAEVAAAFTPPTNTHTGDSNTLGLYRFEGSGIDSAADTTPPAANPVPTIPTNVNANASAGQVSLTWTASTDDVAVTGYRIYRRGTLVGTSVGTSFTEAGLPGGIRYEYRVTSIDGAGNESDLSAIAGATTPDALKPGAALVIFDADMSSDIDDIGALATLHALADLGECKILGMGVSSTNGGTAETMDVVNTYYGRPDIPIGIRAGTKGWERSLATSVTTLCSKSRKASHSMYSPAVDPPPVPGSFHCPFRTLAVSRLCDRRSRMISFVKFSIPQSV